MVSRPKPDPMLRSVNLERRVAIVLLTVATGIALGIVLLIIVPALVALFQPLVATLQHVVTLSHPNVTLR